MDTQFRAGSGQNRRQYKENAEYIFQKELSLKDALIRLKSEYGCERITIQTGGTLNGLFLREKLFDYVDIVVAPISGASSKGTS